MNYPIKVCPICGNEFQPQLECQKYCTVECGLLRMKTRMSKCAFCEKEFLAKSHENFCCEECRNKFFETTSERKFHYSERDLICKNCGKLVSGKLVQERQEFCSFVCQRRYYSKIGQIKRKEQMKRLYVEKVTLDEIFERDKGICQICGKPVDRELECTNKYSPTIDHIIPLSKNGKHEKSNCQLAHRRCNSIKSNKTLIDNK